MSDVTETAAPETATPETAPQVDLTKVNVGNVQVSLMVVRSACEQLEMRHNLIENGYVPTPQFLLDLAQSLQSLGAPECDATDAWFAWREAWEKFQELKKKRQYKPSSPTGIAD